MVILQLYSFEILKKPMWGTQGLNDINVWEVNSCPATLSCIALPVEEKVSGESCGFIFYLDIAVQ